MKISRLNTIQKRNKLIKVSFIMVGVIFCIAALFIGLRISGFYQSIHTEAQTSADKKVTKEEQTEYTFLLLGYGGGSHEGTYLTDSIIVVNVNLNTKRAILISLPRDIWVKVPTIKEDFHSKINGVYQMGMFPKKYPAIDTSLVTEDNPSGLLKKVVEDITGLRIDAFAAIDFEGFTKAIDTLGGVNVSVKKSFTDYEYPIEEKMNDLCGRDEEFVQIEPIINKEMSTDDQKKLFEEKPDLEEFYTDIKDRPPIAFPCRYEILSFSAGETQMDGETALKYARSRHALEDGGDFNRARRQQNVIDAAKQKILGIGFIPKIIPLLNDLEQHVKTDLPLADLNKLLFEATNADQYETQTLVLSDKFLTDGYSSYGGYIIVPKAGEDNWSVIQKEIQNMRMGITPTPSVKPTTK